MTLLGSTVAASSGTFIAGMLIPSMNSKGIIAGYCFTIFPGACAVIGLFVIPRRRFIESIKFIEQVKRIVYLNCLIDIGHSILLRQGIQVYVKWSQPLIMPKV